MNEYKELKEAIEKWVDKTLEIASSITKEDLKKLNAWEREFLESIDRLLEMGMVLSEKQLKKLQQIDDKLCKLE